MAQIPGGRSTPFPQSREELLNPGALEKYEREVEALETSLTHLHTNCRMLWQFNEYPTEFFQVSQAFVYMTSLNLFHMSLVIVHRLWSDRSSGLTLPEFQERVREWVEPRFRDALEARIEAVETPPDRDDVLTRIEDARNKRLAHLDHQFHLGEITVETNVSVEELRSVAHWLGNFYNALTVEEHNRFSVIEMGSEGDVHGGALGWVLDCLAAQSKWVSAYDENPDYWWRNLRPQLSKTELEEVNQIRGAVGLEPVQEE